MQGSHSFEEVPARGVVPVHGSHDFEGGDDDPHRVLADWEW